MRSVFFLLISFALFVNARGQSADAAGILRQSEERVEKFEKMAGGLNGTMKASVSFESNVLGKTASGASSYEITVKDGLDVKNQPMGVQASSDSMVSRMMARESSRQVNKPALRIYDSAFPWERFLQSGNEKRKFRTALASDSDRVSGRRCYRISFSLDSEGDSVSAAGKGSIWIDRSTLLPVRTWRDFTIEMKRGKAEVKSFSDFGTLPGGFPVLLRSEIQTIPKFLFVGVGSIRIIIEQSDFKLE